MKAINNKSLAGALQAACAANHQTVHCFRSSLPKAAATVPAAPEAKKVDLTKRPKPSAAMQGVVDSATVVAKGKAENYSAEVTEQLVQAYNGGKGKTVEELAAAFGKTSRSIVAKLSKELVYVKKVYTTKSGGVPVSKEEHVKTIAAFMGVDTDKLESLEKANKSVLQLIEEALKRSAHDADNRIVGESEEDKASKDDAIGRIASTLGIEPTALKSLKRANCDALAIIASAM